MSATPQPWRATLVARKLQQGAVIAYPTEGVWGLGCLPHFRESVARILELKNRSWEEGLILAAGDIGEVAPYLTRTSEAERAELDASWPGPVTFLVPDNGTAPEWIRGRNERVAIRVSAHPVIRAICANLRGPIVSTSANPSGKPPATDEFRLRKYFPAGIDYIFPGKLGGAAGATEIRELGTGVVKRPASSGTP